MRRDMMTARFKRDYVAFLAVALFFGIVAVEVMVAIWIPMQMHNDNLFAERIIRIRTVSRFDVVRKRFRAIIKAATNPNVTLEANMLLAEMDALAIYMNANDNSKHLTGEQVKMLGDTLRELELQAGRLTQGGVVTEAKEIDVEKTINAIAEGKLK